MSDIDDDDAMFEEEAEDFANFDPARYLKRRSNYADRSADDIQDASSDFPPLEPARRSSTTPRTSRASAQRRATSIDDRVIQRAVC